jgi:hypothetical protein
MEEMKMVEVKAHFEQNLKMSDEIEFLIEW